MRRYLLLPSAVVLLVLVAGGLAACLWRSTQPDDVFGTVYAPFPQRSPQELEAALRSVPPAKPGPLLSVEVAQRHTNFPLVLMRCPDLAPLEGVRLTKEVFPDGSVGKVFTQVVYQLEGKEITLTEIRVPNDPINRPGQAEQIVINGNAGFLVKDWVPDRTELWWARNDLHLRLSADKAIPPDVLTQMGECVR